MAWNQREDTESVILATGYAWSDPLGLDKVWRFWKSTDGGATWRRISVDPGIDEERITTPSVAINPYGQALLVVANATFTGFLGGAEPFAVVMRSWDAAETWEAGVDPSGGYAVGVQYAGQNPPLLREDSPPPVLPFAQPPLGPFNGSVYFTDRLYEFHSDVCTVQEPSGGGGGPGE